MPNMVEIVIRVDNAQGVTALNATTGALKVLGVEADVTAQKLNSAANAAGGMAVKWRQMSAETDNAARSVGGMAVKWREHTGHATTSLDAVRLLSQEFGLRLPRALEAMLSRMPGVTSALTSFIGLSAGLAIGEVVYRSGEALYNLQQKYISLTAAAEAYHKEVEKRRDEDFVNPQSIEDTTARIQSATNAARTFLDVGQQIHNSAWKDLLSGNANQMAAGLGSLLQGRSDTDAGYKNKTQADSLNLTQISQQHEINRLQIESNHALDGHLQGQKKISAELTKKLALDAEDERYTKQRGSALQTSGNTSSGVQKRQLDDQIAQGDAAAARINLEREVHDKTIAMQDEARNAGLRGNALYVAQREEAEATIRRSATGTQAEIDAVRRRFFNEERARTLELTELAAKSAEAARRVGLEGVPAIAAELRAKLDEIQQMQDKTSGGAPLTTGQNNAFSSMRNSANQESIAKREKLDADYTDYVNEQVARRADAEMGAFAKVAAAQARERQDAEKKYSKNYTKDGDDIGSDTNHADRARELVSIDADAAAQRRKLEEDLNQRTLQMDTDADQAERRIRGSGLNAWVENYRSSVVAIEAARDAMRSKIDREENQPGVTGAAHDSFERQKVDADRRANAQIVELNQQMRSQLANNLQSAFDDPVHYIQNRMKQMFFQMLADWLLQSEAFKSTFGRMMGDLHLGGASAHSAGVGSAIGQVGGAGIPSAVGVPSGTSGTGGGFAGSSGTVNQALSAPGSGTAAMTPFGALSDASSLVGVGTSALSAFSGGSSTSDDSAHEAGHSAGLGDAGSPGTIMGADDAGGAAAGMSSAMGIAGAGFGAYTGTKGIISAFESGHASGILSGAMSGAAMGASIGMLGGPVGSAIGAGVGAVGGAAAGLVGWASGEGNRIGAGKYYKSTILPQMVDAETAYVHGSGDALTAISAVDSAATGGYRELQRQFGASAAAWAKTAYIDKKRMDLEEQINSMAKGGRDYTSASAVQFHTGGRIAGFGDLGTSSTEGFIHAMLGETVINPVASSAHGPAISAMNSGASEAQIAAMYLRGTGSMEPTSARSGSGDTHHHWSVQTVDASSFRDMLTNRGGMDAIAQATNKRTARYAGDAN